MKTTMKTIVLKLTVEAEDLEASNMLIEDAIENGLSSLAIIEWSDRDATAKEVKEAARQETERYCEEIETEQNRRDEKNGLHAHLADVAN